MSNIERAAKKIEDATMRKLAIEYNIALKAVQKEMQSVYAKYAVDGKLTMAEMAKYNRLQALEKSINKELGRVSGITTRSVNKLQADIYKEAYYMQSFEIEKGVNLNLSYGQLPTKQVEAAITNPYTKIALENNKEMIRRNIQRDVTQGIVRGLGYKEVAREIKKSLETNLNNANRIARTEGHRARETGSFDSMQRADELGVVMKKQWVSALDNRTRDTHQSVDGQQVDVDESFNVNGEEIQFPGDPSGSPSNTINCRCTTIGVIEGVKPNTRASKAGPIKYLTYEEWSKNKI